MDAARPDTYSARNTWIAAGDDGTAKAGTDAALLLYRSAADSLIRHPAPHPVKESIMENSTRFGRVLFGMGMLAFGVLNLTFATPVPGIEPLPAWLPAQTFWTYATGLLLVAAGICTLSDRLRPRQAAVGLGVLLFLWIALLHVPAMLTHIHNGSVWTSAFECFAMCCAAWVLADALSCRVADEARNELIRPLAGLARYGFGISLPVFGALHFIYWEYVASVIPTWIPGSPVFWAYFTGGAHVTAGLAILSGVAARLASTLLGVMFSSWVLIVHVPRVLARPQSHAEWTSLCVAIALSGGAWLMSGYFSRLVPKAGAMRPSISPAS
ncbi:MAG: hypothetical protein ABI858_04275 [Pseudoxanthomonas sp.]